ncbi:MAG TPA: protein phosphatase 2C domain-containing protein [Kofleriaceae bacterium]
MAGRASIVGAAATHVGKVRDHNEDAHHFDGDLGLFLVCDGMGGHAAGEVASAIAVQTVREEWSGDAVQHAADAWLADANPETKKALLGVLRAGVIAAHDAILSEAARDRAKTGMGTTLVAAIVVGGEAVFAHAGDSRAYLVRDGISMQLTEDHTLLARLLAAGIDVDVTGEGSRFRSMLTNALGIGDECKVSTFVVPLADGDRFLLCSDGISEYVPENEVGEVLTKQPSPARAAQRLVDLALERGGGDNATAVVVRVLEAGETPLPAEQRKKDDAAVRASPLWGTRVTPQQQLRALRIAIPREYASGERLPAFALGDRVAWILVEGTARQDGEQLGAGALVYPESLLGGPIPERDALATVTGDVRALAIRSDDFRELCEDDTELGEALLESLGVIAASKMPRPRTPKLDVDAYAHTLTSMSAAVPPESTEAVTRPEIAPRATTQEPETKPELPPGAVTTRQVAATLPGIPVVPAAAPVRTAAVRGAALGTAATIPPPRIVPKKTPPAGAPIVVIPPGTSASTTSPGVLPAKAPTAPAPDAIARLPLQPPRDEGEVLEMEADEPDDRASEESNVVEMIIQRGEPVEEETAERTAVTKVEPTGTIAQELTGERTIERGTDPKDAPRPRRISDGWSDD